MTRQPLRPSERIIAIALPRPASVTRTVGLSRSLSNMAYLGGCAGLEMVKVLNQADDITSHGIYRLTPIYDREVFDETPQLQVFLAPVFQRFERSFALSGE